MSESIRRRSRPSSDVLSPELSNECPQVEALDRQTDAITALAAEVKAAVAAMQPACDAVADLGHAQQKLCGFLVNNRMKLTGGVFGIMVAAGVISPNLAAVVTKALHAVGWM